MLLATTAYGSASPIAITYLPPDLDLPQTVCAPRVRDDATIAEWTAWNGEKLPKRDPYTIQRDLNRLRDLDAAKYQKIILRIIELMPSIRPNYTESDAKLDIVRMMLAMGQSEKVRSQRLVNDLLDTPGQSPAVMNSLADFLLAGNGIELDRDRGMKLKADAAYSGNADAVLDLAEMTQNGGKIDNWDLSPEIAVNIAFGSLVGTLNSGICDRVGRIAREFSSGVLVKKDVKTSEAWYRFAADLGDTYSAWRVAEYHLESDQIVKDNDVLLKYLTLAADGGNMAAMLELGRFYEEGSLVNADKAKAMHYYEIAASAGNQAGLVRIVQLLEETKDRSSKDAEQYEEALKKLIALENPPAWAYMRLARITVSRKGQWAAANEARGLYEKAAALGDADGKISLAHSLLMVRPKAETLTLAANLLNDAVQTDGWIDAMADLQRLFLCVNPTGPDLDKAQYWRSVEDGAGSKTLMLRPEEVASLSNDGEPFKIAAMQTQALYRRPSALAIYQRYLAETSRSASIQRFWDEYGAAQAGVDAAKAFLEFKIELQRGDIAAARARIVATDVKDNTDTALSFSRFLIENYTNDHESLVQATSILKPLAERGIGGAVRLLKAIEARAANVVGKSSDSYVSAMKDRGDMSAQLLLADSASDPMERDGYYSKAIGAQRCDYDDTMLLADFALRHHKMEDVARWLKVAEYFIGNDPWRMVRVADVYMSLNRSDSDETALELYKASMAHGETAAYFRLVKYYGNEKNPGYDPGKAGAIFADLLTRTALKDVPDHLGQLARMKPAIQQVVNAQINVRDLYQQSADDGQPVAMRELAKLLQQLPKEKNSASKAAKWLTRAAEAGDTEAMFLLAHSYAFGTGVELSIDRSRHWLAKAAEGGNQGAAQMLALTKTKSKE